MAAGFSIYPANRSRQLPDKAVTSKVEIFVHADYIINNDLNDFYRSAMSD